MQAQRDIGLWMSKKEVYLWYMVYLWIVLIVYQGNHGIYLTILIGMLRFDIIIQS